MKDENVHRPDMELILNKASNILTKFKYLFIKIHYFIQDGQQNVN